MDKKTKFREETSSGVIIFHNDKYLLLQYSKGHWDFPKGHVEKNESLEETAVRETKEETNLDVEIIPEFKEEISYKFRDRDKKLIKKKVYFFAGKPLNDDVRLSFEHKSYGWLQYEKAIEKLTYKNAKKILEKAHKFILSLPYR